MSKKSFKSNGGKRDYKKEFKSKKDSKFKGKDYNDVSWYTQNVQLVKDTASLPYNMVLNNPFSNRTASGTMDMEGDRDNNHLPGFPYLMTIAHDWVLPNTEDISTAGKIIWTDIRKVNSGATNYQGMDVISVLTAVADIFIGLTWASSFFGIANTFNGRSKDIPHAIFMSANLKYKDFIANMTNYRARLNTLLLRARSLKLPKRYPWIDSAMSLYGKLFKDQDTDTGREQLYWVNKLCFHIYREGSKTVIPYQVHIDLVKGKDISESLGQTLSEQIAELPITTTYWNADSVNEDQHSGAQEFSDNYDGVKFSVYLDIIEAQIDAIIRSESANIIMGDLMKAFGDSDVWTTGTIDDSYVIEPVYSEEFGWLIHNATLWYVDNYTMGAGSGPFINQMIRTMSSGTTLAAQAPSYINDIAQLPGENKFNIELYCYRMDAKPRWYMEQIIDTDKLNPTAEDNVWYTRAINDLWSSVEPPAGFGPIISTMFLCNPVIWNKEHMSLPERDNNLGIRGLVFTNMCNAQVDSFYKNYLLVVSKLSVFNWKPLLRCLCSRNPASSLPSPCIIGDVTNVISINYKTLKGINEMVSMSLLGIPSK